MNDNDVTKWFLKYNAHPTKIENVEKISDG